jgi:hypothetical protein
MFDADDDELHGVCRSDTCDLDYIHPSHAFALKPVLDVNGRPPKEKRDPTAFRRHDPAGLAEALHRAFATEWPLVFCDVERAVVDDYGNVSSRTLHREIQSLVAVGFILVLKLHLPCLAYIRATSRRRQRLEELRDYLLAEHGHFTEPTLGRFRRPKPIGVPCTAATFGKEGWRHCGCNACRELMHLRYRSDQLRSGGTAGVVPVGALREEADPIDVEKLDTVRRRRRAQLSDVLSYGQGAVG